MKKYILAILAVWALVGCKVASSGNDSILVKNVTKEVIWNEVIRSCGMEGFPITYQDFEIGEMRIEAGVRSDATAIINTATAVAYTTQQGVQVYVKQKGSDVIIKSVIQGDSGFADEPIDRFVNQIVGKYEIVKGYFEEPTYLTPKTQEEILEIIDTEL